jgi:hyperosmotically inducible protein
MNAIRRSVAVLCSLVLLLGSAGCERSAARAARALAGAMQPPVRGAADPARTGASAGVDAAAMADQRKDATIAIKVTTGLAADSTLSALAIQADSQGGVVTLRGLAPTAAAKQRAEEIARNVMGVSDVHNALRVPAL